MSVTTITAGMTPAQYKTVYNANLVNYTPVGKSVQAKINQRGHEVKSALLMNNLSDIQFGIKGVNFISSLNSSFTNLSLADITIEGAADVKTFGATGNGTTDDVSAINSALVLGNIIIQNGTFKISSAILIPSNRTIYIKNAKILRANLAYDNVFRNTNINTGDTNITIIGLGHAEIDGNAANNDYQHASPPFSDYMYKIETIFFCGVSNLEIKNIYFNNFNIFLFYLQKCSYGYIHDCYVDRYTKLSNQDFVSICNSNTITFENLSISNGDDVFGLWALSQSQPDTPSWNGIPDWNVGDVFNINIKNIHLYDSNLGGFIAALCGDGRKIYNIICENIKIDEAGSIFYGSYPESYFMITPPTKDEFYNISIKKVIMDFLDTTGNLRNYPFYFGQNMKNFTANKIYNNTGKSMYYKESGKDVSDNVTINGTQVT